MAIGFDATPLRRRRSGIGTYTENLIRALAASGSAPEILLLSNRPPELDDGFPGGCRVHAAGRFPLRAPWMQLCLPFLIEKLSLELCHFPNYLAPIATRCPIVVTFHDMALFRYRNFFTWKKRVLTRSLIPQIAHKARAIITVSDSSRREIMELLRIPSEKIHVVYEAPGETFRPVLDRQTRDRIRRRYRLPDRYVLSVATLEPRKNVCRLTAAYEAMLDARPDFLDTQLVLVGERGWKYNEILESLDRLKTRGQAQELGYVPLEDLPAIYSMASVFAYPSLYEGFGLPVLEGMACGVPVLTSDRSSLTEIAGTAALQVNPEDVTEIRRGLERILSEPTLAQDLAYRGLQHVQKFSWHKAAGETLEVYRAVLHRRRLTKVPEERAARGSTPSDGELARGVLRAVHFADLFDYPLSLTELHRNLVGIRITRGDLERCLGESGLLQTRIVRTNGYLHFGGRQDLSDHRDAIEKASQQLLDQNEILLKRMARLPYVRMLAIQGDSSRSNSDCPQDVELFAIAAPGRVWLAYALLVLAARLHGRRQVLSADIVVDERHLQLPGAEDLLTAHQLLHLRPLTGERPYRCLLDANAWMQQVFPNAELPAPTRLWPRSRWGQLAQRVLEIGLWPVWAVAEHLAHGILAPRLRRESLKASADGDGFLAENGILRLHAKDDRASVLPRFRERLEKEGLLDASVDRLLDPELHSARSAPGTWGEPPAEARATVVRRVAPEPLPFRHPSSTPLAAQDPAKGSALMQPVRSRPRSPSQQRADQHAQEGARDRV